MKVFSIKYSGDTLPAHEKPFSVFTTYRPRRIAFLIDPHHPDIHSILDAIADFSYDTWGGTYNPIIPVNNGRVHPNFWQLLDAADPDIFYSYTEIEPSEVQKLDFAFNPTKMLRHRYGDKQKDFSVWIQGQSTIENEIADLGYGPVSKIPNVLMWSDSLDKDRFLRRNFGLSRLAYNLAAHGYLSKPRYTPTRLSVSVEIARRSLISTRYLSSIAPLKYEFATRPTHLFEILICYGDSPWNFIHFWNESYRHGFPDRKIPNWIQETWIPDEMSDSNSIHPLIELINNHFPHSRDHHFALTLKIVSYDHNKSELNALSDILSSKCKGPVTCKTVTQISSSRCNSKIVRTRPIRDDSPQHDQLRGEYFFIPLIKRTSNLNSEEVWMADIRLQSTQDLVPEVSWWKMPKRSKVAELMHDATLSRIARDHVLSIEVSNRTKQIDVALPEKNALFTALVNPELRYSTTTDLRYPLANTQTQSVINTSDKGKYLDGILNLFGDLHTAGNWMENDFWREIINAYSSPRNSGHSIVKIQKDIGKLADNFIKKYGTDKSEATSQLAEKMLHSLATISQRRETFNFQELNKRWQAYSLNLQTSQKQAAEFNSLARDLSELCNKNILMQGCKVRCDTCLSVFWYHINDLKATFRCQGCRKFVALPVELPWAYQLNDLVRNGVRDHGITAVIRTAFRLMKESKSFFRLFVGLEIFDLDHDSHQLIGEFDLCWVADGIFGIAEVKTSTKDFTSIECERIVSLSRRVLPDHVLLAAVTGADSQIESAADKIREKLNDITVRCFTPSSFFNTTYSSD